MTVSLSESQSAGRGKSYYKWYIMILASLTATLVVAMPSMSMPVLFAEISEDIGLTIVQIGAVWGTASLAGLFTGLAAGTIGDKFGTKRTLVVGCVLIGIAGAMRAFSTDFITLSATVFLGGLLGPIIPLSLHKACGVWFSGRHLGLANGFVAAGMAFGFMVGAMVSATVLSPLLGGWRQVMIFYGIVAMVMSIPWALSRAAPDGESAAGAGSTMSMRQALSHVARLKNVWILGLAMLGIGGCIQGALGYLPLFLRGIGWPGPRADGALATFHAMSLLMVFPIALLSDRLGSRKRFLMVATLMIATGIGSLAIVPGPLVWASVMLAGLVRDGFMAIYMTMTTELDGVGALYAGTAMGLSGTLSRVGGLVAPPLGNSLATYNLSFPFLFWAGMALMGLVCLSFVKEEKPREVDADFAPVASSEYV